MSWALIGYKTWWLPIYFVTLCKEEEDIRQDLCLFLCTSTAEESSHVYVCQIFSGSSLVLTAYSLASVPTKLKTCSCTSWHAFSRSSPPPLIFSPPPPPPPSLFLTFFFFCLDQKHSHQAWLGSKKRQRLNFKARLQICCTCTHARTLSSSNFKQPTSIVKTGYCTDLTNCQITKTPAIIYARKTAT